MQTPQEIAAEDMIEPYEGWSSFPYKDITGKWTIGYGFTHLPDGTPVDANTPPISKQTALKWLELNLRSIVNTINANVHVPLTTDEDAALIDFIYNLGEGNFEASTLLRLLNEGKYKEAADQFPRWDHANGVVIQGLLRRRLSEQQEFEKPEGPDNPIVSA